MFLMCKYLITSGIHCVKLFSVAKNVFIGYLISNNPVLFVSIHFDGRLVLLFFMTVSNLLPPINDRMYLKITNRK